jgi:hypothetical protein
MNEGGSRSLVVAHHHPGRLRVRARALEGDAQLRRAACAAIAEIEGERSAHDTQTGSVLVEYDPERVDASALLATLAEATALTIAPPQARTRPARSTAHDVFEAARALDRHVARWTGGRVDLRVAVPATLGAASVASLLLGGQARTPRWDNLLYWGFTLFHTLNERARRGEP